MYSPVLSNTKHTQYRRRTKDKNDDEQQKYTQQHYQQYDDTDDLIDELLLSSSSSSDSTTMLGTSPNKNEIGCSSYNNKRKMQQPATITTTIFGLKAKVSFVREMMLAACLLMVIWAYGYNKILSSTATDTSLSSIITRISQNNNNSNTGYNTNITNSTTTMTVTSSSSSSIQEEGGGEDVIIQENNNTTTDDGKSQYYDNNNNNTTNTKNTVQEDIETIEIPWNDLRYRRVCTNVGLFSILCMTVRFPFQYTAPDNKSTTRRPILPVADEFYKLDKTNVHHIRYEEWIKCSNGPKLNATADPLIVRSLDDTIIRKCLYEAAYEVARKRTDKQEPVVTFWTRERRIPSTTETTTSSSKGTIYFHGTGHTDAVNRIYQFFGPDHELIVMGASPAPGVTQGLYEMLGTSNCQPTYVHKRPNYNCFNNNNNNSNRQLRSSKEISTKNNNGIRYLREQGFSTNILQEQQQQQQQHQNKRQLDTATQEFDLPFSTLNESQINIGVIDYRSVGRNGQHELPKETVVQHLKVLQRQPGWTTLRNFTLFVEYQLAHIQTQDMLQKNIQKVYELQNRLPKQYMNVQSPAGKEQLKKQGYEVQNIIAFDGLPQFYPTETSGWATTMYFLSTEGFKIPVGTTTSYNITPVAYADICVGPLPKNSLLREINLLNRRRFHALGIKPQFYGRTWEFVNLFWWQMKMYEGKGPGEAGLDCTHTTSRDGINGIHRFFVQAMVDDYFENQ